MSLAFLKLRSNPRFRSGFILSSSALQQIKPQYLNIFRRFASAAVSNQASNNTLFFTKKTNVVQYQQRRPFGRVNIPDLSATDASLESFVEEQLLEGEEGEAPSESLLWKKDSELTPEQQKIKRWELWRSPFIAYAATTGANAALSEKIKIKMWETYKSDPKFWTLGNLSGKFKVSSKRAYAIIVDKRHEEIEEIIAGKPLDSTLLDKFEKEFSHFIFDELPEEMESDDTVSKGKPNYEFVDYEVPQYKAASLYRKMRQNGFGVLIKDELPDQPPLKAMDGLEVLRSQPLVLRKGTKSPEEVAALRKAHNIPEGGGKLTIMDSGLGRHNYKREIYVLEMDGTIRTGSWQERKDLNKQPPRKNLQTRFESEMQFLEDYLKKSLEEKARLAKDPAEQERIRLWREKVDREERKANERKAKAKAEADKALADAQKAVTDAVLADAQKKLQEDPKLLKL